jgi:D-alanine-D-alanine ligase
MTLDRTRYDVLALGMDKQGRCFLNDADALFASQTDVLPVRTAQSQPLPSLLIDGHLAIDVDVVFPVVHGPLYEDGSFQGLLELANVAYVGCGVLSSALGMDKDMAKRIACVDGLETTANRVIPAQINTLHLATFCAEKAAELGWPIFVKPCCMGSSVGIHKVSTLEELHAAVLDARQYDRTVLLEANVVGREIELSVLENADPSAPPLVSVPGEVEVRHADGFYSYTAKYLESEQTLLHIPAALDAEWVQRLQQAAADVFTRLRCCGMARVDFFVNTMTNTLYFNEINTLPGFTSISMYPKLWMASGLSYADLLEKLIDLALSHHQARAQLI